WSFGFALLAILLSVVGVFATRAVPVVASAETSDDAAISAGERMRWIALAAVPSGLVIAVTAYLTTDVAAAPFLWVVPLPIFLLPFVAVLVGGPARNIPADIRRRVSRKAVDRPWQCRQVRSLCRGAARSELDRRRAGVLAAEHL